MYYIKVVMLFQEIWKSYTFKIQYSTLTPINLQTVVKIESVVLSLEDLVLKTAYSTSRKGLCTQDLSCFPMISVCLTGDITSVTMLLLL